MTPNFKDQNAKCSNSFYLKKAKEGIILFQLIEKIPYVLLLYNQIWKRKDHKCGDHGKGVLVKGSCLTCI